MKIEIKRDAILIVPESDQDRAFIEDSLGLSKNGQSIAFDRVDNVALGYAKTDEFCLKASKR